MSEHAKRAAKRAKNSDPINFTCGKCRRVVPYAKGYKCKYCDTVEDEEEDEEE